MLVYDGILKYSHDDIDANDDDEDNLVDIYRKLHNSLVFNDTNDA